METFLIATWAFTAGYLVRDKITVEMAYKAGLWTRSILINIFG